MSRALKKLAMLTALGCAGVLLFAAQGVGYTKFFDLQKCASIPTDVERLACYDTHTRNLGIPTATSDGTLSTTQARYGRWTVRTESQDAGKAGTVYVYSFSDKMISGPDGRPTTPLLGMRCRDMVTSFFIAFPPTLQLQSGLSELSVLYSSLPKKKEVKVDDRIIIGKPKTVTREHIKARTRIVFDDGNRINPEVTASSDRLTWFFGNPVSTIRLLSRHEMVKVSVSDILPNDGEMTFYTDGLTEALVPLRGACTW